MRDKSIISPLEQFSPGRVKDVVEMFQLLNQDKITPKEFMNCFFAADNMELRSRQRFWGTEAGWSLSLGVLLSMRHAVCKQNGGAESWNEFILNEVSFKHFWPISDSVLYNFSLKCW